MFGAFASSTPQSASPRPNGLGVAAKPAEGPAVANVPLERAIERLEEVVDQETTALRSRAAIDLKDFNNRKSQGLLELNRALRGFDGLANNQAARRARQLFPDRLKAVEFEAEALAAMGRVSDLGALLDPLEKGLHGRALGLRRHDGKV